MSSLFPVAHSSQFLYPPRGPVCVLFIQLARLVAGTHPESIQDCGNAASRGCECVEKGRGLGGQIVHQPGPEDVRRNRLHVKPRLHQKV